ncbi:1818_t:CDS:1, partial [Gigaspora rosea]
QQQSHNLLPHVFDYDNATKSSIQNTDDVITISPKRSSSPNTLV